MSKIFVGLVSDSHGRKRNMLRMADEAPDVAAWIHGGDYCDDSTELAAYTGVPVYAVRGNNDFRTDGFAYPDSRNITVGGITITVIHGHQWYGADRLEKLAALGKKNHASIVMFGHTHRQLLTKKDGIIIVNPGSIGLSRDSIKGTYGICAIEGGKVDTIQLHELT